MKRLLSVCSLLLVAMSSLANGGEEAPSGGFFQDADLRGDNFENANLSNAFLDRADLSDAILINANVSSAFLHDADLSNALLTDADLSDSFLDKANLREATLTRASLNGAFLDAADLTGANFESADLSGAELIGASLQSATWQDANLSNVVVDARALDGADLTGAWVWRDSVPYYFHGDRRFAWEDVSQILSHSEFYRLRSDYENAWFSSSFSSSEEKEVQESRILTSDDIEPYLAFLRALNVCNTDERSGYERMKTRGKPTSCED